MTDLRLTVIEEEPKTPDSPRTPEPIEDILTEGKSVSIVEEVRTMLKEHYRIMAVDVWPMPSMSIHEIIFKVRGNREGVIQEFTLKVNKINQEQKNFESRRMTLLDCQIYAMEHLSHQGILCPSTVQSISGELYSIIHSNDGDKLIQLSTFMKGNALSASPIDEMVLYDTGVLLASLRKSFQTFHHPFMEPESAQSIWKKENFCNLLNHIPNLHDESMKQLTENVVHAFCQDFENRMHALETGYNHGDLHPANIINTKTDLSLGILERYAVIDFSLLNYSFQIFDLSVALASFMMAADSNLHFIEAGGHLLAGYQSVDRLNSSERDLLYICVCVLYCKVLFTTSSIQELLKNDYSYIGNVTRRVEPQLRELWQTPQRVVLEKWNSTCAKYGQELL